MQTEIGYFELGLWKRYFSPWVHIYPTSAPVCTDSWQFLNFPPTMEIFLAIIAHPIYPLPQTFSNFSRERKITPGLQLFFVFDIIYSDLIETHFSPVVSSGPHWPVSFHGTLLSSCCTINSISVPSWTHSWKKLIQLSPILWLLPQSYIFEESNSWTRWSI